jgi:hypothetical protein
MDYDVRVVDVYKAGATATTSELRSVFNKYGHMYNKFFRVMSVPILMTFY